MKFLLAATLAMSVAAYPADKVPDRTATISMTIPITSKTSSASTTLRPSSSHSSSSKKASTTVRVTSVASTTLKSSSAIKTTSTIKSSLSSKKSSVVSSATATKSSFSSFPSSTTKCYPFTNITQAFYSFSENSRGGSTVFDCGRAYKAGGNGSFADPLTFAGAPGEFMQCEVVYNPYLRKYMRNEDYCSHKNCPSGSVMIWTGTAVDGGSAQVDCENKLAAKGHKLVRNPMNNLKVDSSALWAQTGGKATCNTTATYKSYDIRDSCS